MLKGRWSLHLAVLVCVSCIDQAQAQTVVVANAPPGTAIEFVLEASVAASGTVDGTGIAILRADPSALGTRQIDALMRVDTCATGRRVLVTSRAGAPPPAGLCTRVELADVFLVQPGSSLLFDLGGTTPTVRLWQGRPPDQWLRVRTGGATGSGVQSGPPTGLVLSAGVGLGEFRDFHAVQCGTLTACTGDAAPRLMTAGLSYWFSPYVGAEATFVKPGAITASASEERFQFNSSSASGVMTAAGLGGVPIGPVRIFGKFGTTYHRATVTPNQTIADATATVDDETHTVAGGTQTTQTRTGGWGWVMAAGAEVWLTRPVGVYGEYGRFAVKGSDLRGGESRIDDLVTYIMVGAKVRLPIPW